MARCGGRATSRFNEEILTYPRKKVTTSAVWLCFCLLFPSAAEAGLYTASDQIVLLTPENVESVLINSTAAIVVEFYASWCGHCIAFSPFYKSLARDIKGWCSARSRSFFFLNKGNSYGLFYFIIAEILFFSSNCQFYTT